MRRVHRRGVGLRGGPPGHARARPDLDGARVALWGTSMGAAIAPSSGFGMIVDDAAFAAFERLAGPDSTYRNAVAARSILTFDDWNPAPRAGEIAAPILLVASPADRFAPFAAVEAFARAAQRARIARIDGDHFDVYASPILEQAAELEVAFLVEHLH